MIGSAIPLGVEIVPENAGGSWLTAALLSPPPPQADSSAKVPVAIRILDALIFVATILYLGLLLMVVVALLVDP